MVPIHVSGVGTEYMMLEEDVDHVKTGPEVDARGMDELR